MTVGEFLVWNAPGPCFWQLIDGVPMAMAPAAPIHAAIQMEVGSLIRNHLAGRGGACVALANPGVIPPFMSDRTYLVPGLGVTCSPSDIRGKAGREPVLLIEILSPSNHAETWRNVWSYVTIPSSREVLVIRSTSLGIELPRRDANWKWPGHTQPIASGPFSLTSIDLDLTVEALYRGLGLI